MRWWASTAALLALALGASGCSDPAAPAGGSSGGSTSGATGGMTTTSGTNDVGNSIDPSSSSTALGSSDSSSSGGRLELPERLLVTADWRARRLSIVDLETFASGAGRDASLVGEVDLSMYEPGPLQVELSSSGERALVSISPGFFDGIVGNTIGASDIPLDGVLLVVDLATVSVLAELPTAHVPMGLAIAADDRIAYSANYGHSDAPGTTLSVIDLEALVVVEDIEVGARPEQVSLSSDGALGILNLAGDGTVRVFETQDPAGTMSEPLAVSGDPSDVDFIDGTSLAVVANSLSPQNYAVVDVVDPAAPVLVTQGDPPGGFPYGATRIPGTRDFLLTVSAGDLSVLRIDASADPPSVVWRFDARGVPSFPLGVTVDPTSDSVFVAAPGANAVVQLGLDGALTRTEAWQSELGPTYVAVSG